MKPETLIYERIRDILPEKSEKTVFFAGITDTSQEVFFYSFFDGKPVQCYTLTEQSGSYRPDENELAAVFSDVVSIIRASKLYAAGKYNVITILTDKSGIRLEAVPHELEESEYRIQKEWKKKFVG
jgi:hypothetical protein